MSVNDFFAACKAIIGSAPSPILDEYIRTREGVDVIRDCVKCYNKNFASMKYEDVMRSSSVLLGKRIDMSRLFLAAPTASQRTGFVCAFMRVIIASSSMSLRDVSPVPAKHIAAARGYVAAASPVSSSASSDSTSEEVESRAGKMMGILSNLRANISGSAAATDSIVLPAGISLGPDYVSPTKSECIDWLEGIAYLEEVLAKRDEGDGSGSDTSSSSS